MVKLRPNRDHFERMQKNVDTPQIIILATLFTNNIIFLSHSQIAFVLVLGKN